MYFVYFLRSESHPEQTYIGYSKCLVDRLKQHNTSTSGHTAKYKPWKVEAFILADTEQAAKESERYFKSPSGKEKFTRFADSYPEHPNPIQGFFDVQEEGRKFGRSRFKVGKNDVAVMTGC